MIDDALSLGVGGFVIRGGRDDEVRDLTADLRRRSSGPLLVAADLEDDALRPLRAAIDLPSLAALGRMGDVDAVRRAARLTASAARRVGVNWILAPICDLDPRDRSRTGARAFGDDPAVAAELAAEWIDACQSHGVLACAKHFPGRTRTATSSAPGAQVVAASTDVIFAVDLVPFRAAIDAGVASIMAASVAYPELDPAGAPATLSRAILRDILRTQLGFEGLAVSDVLASGGMRRSEGDDIAVDALAAGCDLLIEPSDASLATRAIEGALKSRRLDGERLRESTQRLRRWADWAAVPR